MPHQTHPKIRTRISNTQNYFCQGSGFHAHRPCQVHPSTSYSSNASSNEPESEESNQHRHGLRSTTLSQGHDHHSSCPRFHSQEALLPGRMSQTQTTGHTQYRRDIPYVSPETQHHVRSEPRYHARTAANSSNYRLHKEPFPHKTVEITPRFESCHAHPRTVPMKPPSFTRTTIQGPESDEAEGNVKSVRFSDEEDSVPEHRSVPEICPVHHRRSSDGRRYGLYGNILPQTTRASRTYKWVWGPPLPEGFRDGYRR